MTIKLTLSEVRSIINKHFNFGEVVSSLELEIQNVKKEDSNNSNDVFNAKLEMLEKAICSLNYTSNEKISAIKLFRAMTGSGLAEAKYSIEDFNQFFYLSKEAGRFVYPNPS